MNSPKAFRVPSDFFLNYRLSNGNFLSPLLVTTYSIVADGQVRVKAEYVREIKTEERQLTAEQVETVARRAEDAHLFDFAKQAESLRERCLKRETDQPTRQIELQWEGQRVKLLDDFDPQRCSEARALREFTEDLPPLLEGRLIKTESQAAPWPR
jgi:hypothetical protein